MTIITPIEDVDGRINYTFDGLTKHGPDNLTSQLERIREFTSSNGMTVYTVSLWDDGQASCNCPAWTFKRGQAARNCKHCKTCRTEGADSMNLLGAYAQPVRLGRPTPQAREVGERESRGVRLRKRGN